MKSINPWQLGGTLFVPATHKHLHSIAHGTKFPLLRSMVIDTEDGILESDMKASLELIRAMLPDLKPGRVLRFIRPRDSSTLKELLHFQDIGAIDGFVLPKFGLDNREEYLQLLKNTRFHFMPSIEGSELFDVQQLAILRDTLLPYRLQIPFIRFGAEDMLKQLGLRRECTLSLFDMCVPSYVLGMVISTFKPHGFDLSGGVYRCYKDHDGFKRDVLRDLQEGLIGKTIIHPDQIDLIEECYRVTPRELQEAQQLRSCRSAVFSLNESMAEVSTQLKWGESILKREEIYGMIDPMKSRNRPI